MTMQLYQGDCLEILPTLPEQSVDAIITDLPYGTTACAWDEIIPFVPMWEQSKRVLKRGGVFVTTSSQPFTSKLVISNLDWFKYELIWEKSSSTGFLDANRKPLKAHENILVFSEGRTIYNPQKVKGEPTHFRNANPGPEKYQTYRGVCKRTAADTSGMKFPRSVIRFSKHPETEPLHPNQKPVALYEYLILTYTNPGAIILDIAAGSGTTGEAGFRVGRNCILIEKDAGYFETMQKRIKAVQMQPILMDIP